MSIFKDAVRFVTEHVVGIPSIHEDQTSSEAESFFRHGSSSQVRENVKVKWYIDGRNYFYAVSEALMAAKEEIFIESWLLNPELHFRRPPDYEYRLDALLKKKAEAGIKIYLVIYNGSLLLDLNSKRSKNLLRKLHKNIYVQRHPKDDFFHWAVTAFTEYARNFIEKWNHIKKLYDKKEEFPSLVFNKNQCQYKFEDGAQTKRSGSCSVQILRSSSTWSHGIPESERSIQDAYIDTIKKAKYFVYIENQFFTTKETEDYQIKNLIGKAIVERVVQAYKNDEKFRIIITLQLIPAASDEIKKYTYENMLTKYYQSICRNKNSIINRIKKAGCDTPERYISFYTLRAHNETGTCTTEVSIQSKLLIVDDRIVIIGSANLMDRSLNGDRDSEVAAIIEDRSYIESKMDGMKWEAGKFSATLRREIFKEHLGLKIEDDHGTSNYDSLPSSIEEDNFNLKKLSYADRIVEDPASDEFYYDYWLRIANTNTTIFRKIFRCVPDNSVTDWDEFDAFFSGGNSSVLEKEPMNGLSRIRGHLVVFPLNFMENEDLTSYKTSRNIPVYFLI
ncbi:16686_t:CDS:10 [Acaulospora colombiana]|uniref:16686_t:CDS:1 n=1 Tax=Acaulospora colombiana TaxID=27376 RepID=A0ACA9LG23_9GLOM|nr:16686_t:CDS:10 [Acaulospora colombiana]